MISVSGTKDQSGPISEDP